MVSTCALAISGGHPLYDSTRKSDFGSFCFPYRFTKFSTSTSTSEPDASYILCDGSIPPTAAPEPPTAGTTMAPATPPAGCTGDTRVEGIHELVEGEVR